MTPDRTPPPIGITVLSGLDRLVVDDLATTLLLRHERLAVVHADPSTADRGHVTIHVHRNAGATASRAYPLEHRCVTCTLRAALVKELIALTRAGEHDGVILQLHPGIQTDSLLRGLHHDLPAAVRLDTHVAVLTADWLDILSGGGTLSDHHAGFGADDDRFAATIVCAAVETATTVLVANKPQRTAEQLADERAVLDLLAPAAVRLPLRHVLELPDNDIINTGRFDARRLDPLAAYGIRDHRRRLTPDSTLSLVRWDAARPLHPIRLHAALDQLANGVIRSSGRLDVADQPDAVVGWDSAGESLQLGPIAAWRAEPRERHSTLTLLGDGLDRDHIRGVLDRCLLDDTELAIVTSAWHDVAEICPGWPTRDPDHAASTDNPVNHDDDQRRRGDDAA